MTFTKTYNLLDAWAESTPVHWTDKGGPKVGDSCCVPGCEETLQKGEVYYYVTQFERDVNDKEQPVCWRHVRPDQGPVTVP